MNDRIDSCIGVTIPGRGKEIKDSKIKKDRSLRRLQIQLRAKDLKELPFDYSYIVRLRTKMPTGTQKEDMYMEAYMLSAIIF